MARRCLTYAVIQLAVSLPCFLLFVPNPSLPAPASTPEKSATPERSSRLAFGLLAAITMLPR